MAQEFDPRILQVGIQIGEEIFYYEDLYITATGTKYGNENLGDCQVRIDNLTREHRQRILTETSKFTLNPPTLLIVNAGRKSYGASQVFVGNVITSQITQPPDIGIILDAQTTYANALQTIAVSFPQNAGLRTIAQKAASDLSTSLTFQAKDKSISNYSFTGSPKLHITKLQETGNVNVFVDNNTLVIKDKNVPLEGAVKDLNLNTGLIGIPEITELGIRVRMLFDNNINTYKGINLESTKNPSLNGLYQIYKLSFDLSSRDTPFYWIAECSRVQQ